MRAIGSSCKAREVQKLPPAWATERNGITGITSPVLGARHFSQSFRSNHLIFTITLWDRLLTLTQFKETELQTADKPQGQDLNMGSQAVKRWGSKGTREWLKWGRGLVGSQWGAVGAFKYGSDVTRFTNSRKSRWQRCGRLWYKSKCEMTAWTHLPLLSQEMLCPPLSFSPPSTTALTTLRELDLSPTRRRVPGRAHLLISVFSMSSMVPSTQETFDK